MQYDDGIEFFSINEEEYVNEIRFDGATRVSSLTFIPKHVFDKYLKEEQIESNSSGDILLIATAKEHVYFLENLHLKGQAGIRSLKIQLSENGGRLKIISFKAGKELFKSEKEEDISTSSLLVAASTEGHIGIWSVEDFLDQALEEPNEEGNVLVEPTVTKDLGL